MASQLAEQVVNTAKQPPGAAGRICSRLVCGTAKKSDAHKLNLFSELAHHSVQLAF
jgi:hypothetical protein